ncbi:MAG: NAD(P)(+) transhydrogenase (Re/Si-specific) subunit beta [Sphaerochaetaceae bacterium]|nr:NAD(P)(+) transhydrogenase (Re/Si-specific) subunit beta [Sphaerochaetaceae bacterium]
MLNTFLPVFFDMIVINDTVYYIICSILVLFVMFGIFLMSKVDKARLGNLMSASAILCGVLITLLRNDILDIWVLYLFLAIGAIIGLIISLRVQMIQMPQMIALLNSLGGLASMIVGGFAFMGIGANQLAFSQIASCLAIGIGSITFFGSLIAAGKLHRILPQKPMTLPKHEFILATLLLIILLGVILPFLVTVNPIIILLILLLSASIFGFVFTIRIGGADMPIVISLLNSMSGLAGAISGLAIGDALLVSIGGIVGASGLLLTQIMCKAMNRNLLDILLGKTSVSIGIKEDSKKEVIEKEPLEEVIKTDPLKVLKESKSVIIVPGYGMAIAQAQHLVKNLADILMENGAEVRYAIHPVAGRMPGHMNVLLAEADVDYDDLYEMDDLNSEFKNVDCTIVIGANDVMNPSAREAEGTPIYGMPILNVDQCKNVLIFNYDLKPGYSGVENPLYKKKEGIYLFLGDAAKTLKKLLEDYKND